MNRPDGPNDQNEPRGWGPGRPAEPPYFGTPGQIPPPMPRGQLPPGAAGGPGAPDTGAQAAGRRDVSAATTLLVAVPWFFWSLILVIWIAAAIGFPLGWIVVVLWVLSGAVVFVPPLEDLIARYIFRLRKPTLIEQRRLGPVWQQLSYRAGEHGGRFSLWIQESDDVNATPTPGHTVAVSRWALYTLPPSHLEAVLAHELSHHLGGRAWLSLLSFWYSIPARLGLVGARAAGRLMRKVPAIGCVVGGFLLMAYGGILLAVLIFKQGYIWPFLFLTPFIAPPFLAWLSRWQVKQADRRTALMGYGETLVQVLHGWQMQHQQTLGRETSRRTQIMSSTPSLVERVQTIERAGGAY